MPRADDADRAVLQVAAHLVLQGKVLRLGAHHDLLHLPQAHEHEHDSVIGDAIRRIGRVRDGHAQLPGLGEGDVVKTDGTRQDRPHAVPMPGFQHFIRHAARRRADGVAARSQVQVGFVGIGRRPHIADAVFLGKFFDKGQLVEIS